MAGHDRPLALTFDFRTAQTFDNCQIIKETATKTEDIKLSSAHFVKVGALRFRHDTYTDLVQVQKALRRARNKLCRHGQRYLT